MRVKIKYKNENKKKGTQSAWSTRSARSAVHSLQSVWSEFWGDRVIMYQSNRRFNIPPHPGKLFGGFYYAPEAVYVNMV